MNDRKFTIIFFSILNCFMIGITLLTLLSKTAEGFIICFIISIVIVITSLCIIYDVFEQ
jgi:hypothetical protein